MWNSSQRSASKCDHPAGLAACTVLANQPLCQMPAGAEHGVELGLLAGRRVRIIQCRLETHPVQRLLRRYRDTSSGGVMSSRS